MFIYLITFILYQNIRKEGKILLKKNHAHEIFALQFLIKNNNNNNYKNDFGKQACGDVHLG